MTAGKQLVGTGRFELPTPRTPSECSTRLSHVPTEGIHNEIAADRVDLGILTSRVGVLNAVRSVGTFCDWQYQTSRPLSGVFRASRRGVLLPAVQTGFSFLPDRCGRPAPAHAVPG